VENAVKMPNIITFIGPSLQPEDVTRYLQDAECRPPAKRGDIVKAVSDGARVIVLIDGVFFQTEAVAHREILSALKAGVKIYGASSMGALRAYELETFGMIGIGKVYEWYHSGKINADDEVGLLFDPDTGIALSDPMVNIRATFEKAVNENILTVEEETELIKTCKGIYYPERTFRRIIKETDISDDKKQELLSWIKSHSVDQKHEDAIECLKKVRDDNA